MSKKDQTKSEGMSIEVKPFTPKERKELQAILDKPHWGRRKMKDEFIAANMRLPEEVDAYIATNGKRKKHHVSHEPISNNRPVESTTKVQPTKIAPEESSYEVRLQFKNIRVEGSTLIIEIER